MFDNGSMPDTLEYLDALTLNSRSCVRFTQVRTSASPPQSMRRSLRPQRRQWSSSTMTSSRRPAAGPPTWAKTRSARSDRARTASVPRRNPHVLSHVRRAGCVRAVNADGSSQERTHSSACCRCSASHFWRRLFDRIGPLDDRYGLGLFEDDDYGVVLRGAGLQLARLRTTCSSTTSARDPSADWCRAASTRNSSSAIERSSSRSGESRGHPIAGRTTHTRPCVAPYDSWSLTGCRPTHPSESSVGATTRLSPMVSGPCGTCLTTPAAGGPVAIRRTSTKHSSSSTS